jgi:adenylate cyclase
MRAKRSRLHAAYFLGIGLIVTGLALSAYVTGVFRRYEADTVDARFALRGDGPAPEDIVLVDVDDKTLQDLEKRWPLPRRYEARVIRRLHEAGAKTIALDIQFTEPTNPKDDNRLLNAVYDARPVVLGTTVTDAAGKTNVFGGGDILNQLQARVGHTQFSKDPQAVLREFPYEVGGLKSFAVVSAETFSGKPVPRSGFSDGQAWIDYVGPVNTFPSLSFSDVWSGNFDASAVRGKLVIVGVVLPTEQDLHPTSVTGDELMTGPEVQANAVSTILRGFPLQSAPGSLDILAIVLLGMFAPLVALRVSFLLTLALSVFAGGMFAVAAQLAFDHGSILAFTYPLGALIVSTAGVLAVDYVLEREARQRTRDVFARFVPEGVVNDVLARAADGLRLGGVRVVGTVMFTDLRGFTTFSEQRNAEEVIDILNRYLSEMSEAILDHGGTLVSYLGDGILAVFGAPIEQPDHAARSYATAREMLDVRLPRFNRWLKEEGHDAQFRMGIGLNTGAFMSGNVGSERRLEYTAIGDTANTASRIESLTKDAGTMLLMSESTFEALPPGTEGLAFYDEVQIRGRQGSVRLWGLATAPKGSRAEEAAEPGAVETPAPGSPDVLPDA